MSVLSSASRWHRVGALWSGLIRALLNCVRAAKGLKLMVTTRRLLCLIQCNVYFLTPVPSPCADPPQNRTDRMTGDNKDIAS